MIILSILLTVRTQALSFSLIRILTPPSKLLRNCARGKSLRVKVIWNRDLYRIPEGENEVDGIKIWPSPSKSPAI
jgi:hypothetical protein